MTAPQGTPAGPSETQLLEPAGPPALLTNPPWPLEPADVADWLGLTNLTDADATILAAVAAQATSFAERARTDRWQPAGDEPAVFVPDAETYAGATMFAARQYRRRNTPSGIQHFGDSGASFVSRFDPDIDRALRIGAFTPPAVG